MSKPKEEFKMCPLMIGKEERKAITYGQGDYTVPIMYPCVGDKCVSYKNGTCMYWENSCRITKE